MATVFITGERRNCMTNFRHMLNLVLLACASFWIFGNDLSATETVEWTRLEKLQLEEPAVDMAISPDGRRIFVLTKQGKVHIYKAGTRESIELEVGQHVDQLQVGPGGDTLILNSRANRSLQVIALDFIQNIDIAGAPFKGPEDAPVVVVVFSDFE